LVNLRAIPLYDILYNAERDMDEALDIIFLTMSSSAFPFTLVLMYQKSLFFALEEYKLFSVLNLASQD
jgi:hypothetical protein